MRVHPTLIAKDQIIANVNGVMNAVLVKGDALGTSLYYGAGAGDEATASAVIADLIDIINNQTSNHILGWKSQVKTKVIDNNLIDSEFYLRLLVSDVSGVLAKLTQIFHEQKVSIEAFIQKKVDADNNAHIAIITNKINTKNVMNIKAKIEASDFNQDSVQVLHVETLD
jgi:homoserine dehydrogenase